MTKTGYVLIRKSERKGENFKKSLFLLQEVNYSLGQTGVGIPMNLDRHTQFLMRKEKF